MNEAGNFLEGIALGWYNFWLNAPSEITWQEFVNAIDKSMLVLFLKRF